MSASCHKETLRITLRPARAACQARRECLSISKRGCPLILRLQAQAEPGIVDSQVALGSEYHRVGHERGNLLRHDADEHLLAPKIAIAVERQSVVELPQCNDVALQAHVGECDGASRVPGQVDAR